MRQCILVLDDRRDAIEFLEDYFSDTQSRFVCLDLKKESVLPPSAEPVLVFANSEYLARAGKRDVSKIAGPKARVYSTSQADSIPGSIALPLPQQPASFEEALFKSVSFPEKINVLVVDDEPEVGAGLKEFLEMRKSPRFEVETALNGLEGFDKALKGKPDVIILDIKMPVKNGYEFYREIRKKLPDCRVIILTAAVSVDEIAEIRKVGSPAFVEKGSSQGSFPGILAAVKKHFVFS